jgi:hypothetical protein
MYYMELMGIATDENNGVWRTTRQQEGRTQHNTTQVITSGVPDNSTLQSSIASTRRSPCSHACPFACCTPPGSTPNACWIRHHTRSDQINARFWLAPQFLFWSSTPSLSPDAHKLYSRNERLEAVLPCARPAQKHRKEKEGRRSRGRGG